MDFDQLTTFVYVAKLKSFSRAGQKVFRSQSAVSAQIRQLEQAYKAKLLDRSAKGCTATQNRLGSLAVEAQNNYEEDTAMKFGLFGINMGACSNPDTATRIAQAAEAAGRIHSNRCGPG